MPRKTKKTSTAKRAATKKNEKLDMSGPAFALVVITALALFGALIQVVGL